MEFDSALTEPLRLEPDGNGVFCIPDRDLWRAKIIRQLDACVEVTVGECDGLSYTYEDDLITLALTGPDQVANARLAPILHLCMTPPFGLRLRQAEGCLEIIAIYLSEQEAQPVRDAVDALGDAA